MYLVPCIIGVSISFLPNGPQCNVYFMSSLTYLLCQFLCSPSVLLYCTIHLIHWLAGICRFLFNFVLILCILTIAWATNSESHPCAQHRTYILPSFFFRQETFLPMSGRGFFAKDSVSQKYLVHIFNSGVWGLAWLNQELVVHSLQELLRFSKARELFFILYLDFCLCQVTIKHRSQKQGKPTARHKEDGRQERQMRSTIEWYSDGRGGVYQPWHILLKMESSRCI